MGDACLSEEFPVLNPATDAQVGVITLANDTPLAAVINIIAPLPGINCEQQPSIEHEAT